MENKKDFKDLIKIEWATLDEIKDDIFKEIKKQNGKNKAFNY